jgi:2-C-methyl-D-erythritol 4-phosphate cytidylyltransferase
MDDYEIVVIHDGVRPFIEVDLIEKTIAAAQDHRAVITALPAKETVKEVNQAGFVVKTFDRKGIWLVQTPQVFRFTDILAAHKKAVSEGWDDVTDDASLVEKMNIPVKVIEGLESNIKITTPHDLEFGRRFIDKRKTL